MLILKGLPNTSEDKEAVLVDSINGFLKAIRAGKAATTAADHGAINVWINDSGEYQCEAMRYKTTLSARTFRSQFAVRLWLRQWMQEIRGQERG